MVIQQDKKEKGGSAMVKIFVIATTGKRNKQLRKTVKSIIDQVDQVLVYDNSKNQDLTDNAKFLYVDAFNQPVYYFTGDDDILYPKGYIKRTIEEIEKNECIISWHGRQLNPNIETYYGHGHGEMRYFQVNRDHIQLDVGGTGVMGFRTDYFKPDVAFSEYKRMSDLVVSLEAMKQGKKIISPPKNHNWIKGQEVKSSIFATESKGKQETQIRLMKELIDLKYG